MGPDGPARNPKEIHMPSEDDYEDYLTGTAQLAAQASADDPQYAAYHHNMNQVLDQMYAPSDEDK